MPVRTSITGVKRLISLVLPSKADCRERPGCADRSPRAAAGVSPRQRSCCCWCRELRKVLSSAASTWRRPAGATFAHSPLHERAPAGGGGCGQAGPGRALPAPPTSGVRGGRSEQRFLVGSATGCRRSLGRRRRSRSPGRPEPDPIRSWPRPAHPVQCRAELGGQHRGIGQIKQAARPGMRHDCPIRSPVVLSVE